ncbi:MAG: ABC transporter permease [Bacteroidota bacterium]
MWYNHLKVAFRSLLKHKLVTSINIAGLGLGVLCSALVLVFIKSELSYDRWIPNQDQVYRLYRSWENGGNGLISPVPMAAAMRDEVSGLEAVTRVAYNTDMLLAYEESFYKVPEMVSTDSHFLDCMALPLAQGNPEIAFDAPNSAVISHKLAQQIFGTTPALGKQLLLENSNLITITGVLAPFKGASHLKADLFLSELDGETGSWTGGYGFIYTRLQNQVNPEQVGEQIRQLYNREVERENKEDKETFDASRMPNWKLQALADIHLESKSLGETASARGSFKQIAIIGLLGLLILLLAVINYINLATAQLNKKSEEIGVRRVIGATQKHLVDQFVGNALVHVFLALILAVVVFPTILPYFNEMISRELMPKDLFNPIGLAMLGGLAFIVAMLTGVFPALYYARLNPVDSIKQKRQGKQQFQLRNALVVVQFTLSIGTLLFVSLVSQQLNFMLDRDLGFAGDQVAVFRINQSEVVEQFQQQKQRIAAIPGVQAVSQMARMPGDFIPNYQFEMEGEDNRRSANVIFGDEDLQSALGIELKDGRYFSTEYQFDAQSSFVVNEAFVRRLGLDNPLGFRINFPGDTVPGQIIGVVKDFHYESMEQAIQPLVISARMDKTWMGRVAVSMEGKAIADNLPAIQDIWKQLEPGFPVTQYFLDERFQSLYDQHLRFKKSLSYTAIVGIFIALLGLLGLTLFVTQQRTKEIGIRKVLGASVASIVSLLSRDLLKLVGLGIVIALPISWYLLQRWLENFAYQTTISWFTIVLFILLALGMAWLTMGIQSIRVAMSNPVNSLTDE